MARAWLKAHPWYSPQVPALRHNGNQFELSSIDDYADWEDRQDPHKYAPLVGRGGLTPDQLDKRIRMDRATARLLPEREELLRMRYSENLSLHDIAEEQGTTYQAVQQRLETATQDLYRAVGETWEEDYDLLEEVFGG